MSEHRRAWKQLLAARDTMTREQRTCLGCAAENADMTAEEQGFATDSDRWYFNALSGYESLMESGEYADMND